MRYVWLPSVFKMWTPIKGYLVYRILQFVWVSHVSLPVRSLYVHHDRVLGDKEVKVFTSSLSAVEGTGQLYTPTAITHQERAPTQVPVI
jgi:hypothetical protein